MELLLPWLLSAILWNDDLDVLQRELPRMHPNAFHAVSRETFETAIARLRERAPSMRAADVAIEIARIVATIGDGHTRLTLPIDPNAGFFSGHTPTPAPPDPALHFRHLPVRFFAYDDGLVVTAAARPDLVGKRVLRFGNVTAEEAMAKASAVVEGDNAIGKRMAAASALAVFEVLQALGIAPELTLEGGETVKLEPVPYGEPAPWLPKADPRKFHYEVRDGVVVFTWNETVDVTSILGPMMAEVERSEALVIDLRANPGGNGAHNRALLHALIRSKRLREPGRLFVLIGRRTFSAAQFLVLDLEQNTNAVFVGEPTGGSPNGYGDSRKLLLPSSGLTVRISTLYWQKSDPRDKRDAVAPDIPVPPAYGRDAAMDEVRRIVAAMRTAGKADGAWTGIVHIDFQPVPLRIADGRLEIPDMKVSCDLNAGCSAVRVGDGILFGTLRADGLEFPLFARRVRS